MQPFLKNVFALRSFVLTGLSIILFVFATKANDVRYQSIDSNIHVIQGYVKDTSQKLDLHNATVMLLRASDSVLIAFTRTAKDGSFILSAPENTAKECLVMVSYPKYADWVDRISISGEMKDVGVIPMNTKAYVMREIIIKSTSPIRIKGDTTEYMADSFKVSANADVQELLRKMPGIQVNAKGEIVAQGQKVQKMLVDGDEFFSDDPVVVSKMLRADMVKKVQVYDKKSDQAEFTGVDDGSKIKTINVELKDDKKNGYFGKVEAGSDFSKYNAGKLMANKFKAKQKIAGHIVSSNTTSEALDWSESPNYGGGNTEMFIGDDGGVGVSFSSEDESYGYPKLLSAGGLYANKWKKASTSTNASVKDLQTDLVSSKKTKSILADQTQTSESNTTTSNHVRRYTLKSVEEFEIDSMTKLNVIAKYSKSQSDYTSDESQTTFKNDVQLLNDLHNKSNGLKDQMNSSLMLGLKHKYQKKGRFLSFTNLLTNTNGNDNANYNALTRFYSSNGLVNKYDSLNQLKTNNNHTNSLSTTLAYNEPLSKRTTLILEYTLLASVNNSERRSLNRGLNGKYDQLVDSLSNHFKFGQLNNTARVSFQYNAKKVNWTAGTGFGKADYTMKDLGGMNSRSESFNTFIPSMRFTYKKRQGETFNLNYSGATNNPELLQLQPLKDNSNPLYVQEGNPLLKQGFSHNMNMYYMNWKVLHGQFIRADIDGEIIDRDFSTSSVLSADGKTSSKYININGNYNFSTSISYGREIAKGFNVTVGINKVLRRYSNYVNGIKNSTINDGYGFEFNTYYSAKKWLEFWVQSNPRLTNSHSTIQEGVRTRYWSYPLYFNVNLKFEKITTYLTFSGDMQFFQKTPTFNASRNSAVLTPQIRKVLTKDKKLEAKLLIYDIFNSRQFVTRNASSNFITEQTSNGIKRYAIFSLIYNFNKNGKASEVF